MVKPTRRLPPKLHPLALRVMHWINAISVIALIFSGWKIYDDAVILGWLHFPDWITLGGHPETALQWHFLFMWPLMLNGLFYLVYGVVSGRFARKLFPVSPSEIIATIRETLSFKLSHDDIRHYNGVQKLLYLGVITILVIQVLSGLAIWKPVQFSELVAVFGSFQIARTVHFIGMALITGFICVHVLLAILVPKTIVAMVTGGPRDEVADDVAGRPQIHSVAH